MNKKEAIIEIRKVGGVCPHGHLRAKRAGEPQSEKATIASTLKIANAMGLAAICDMPNVLPEPVISEEIFLERLTEAEKLKNLYRTKYYSLLGLVDDPKQIRKAIEAYDRNPEIVGFKMFASNTSNAAGNLGITTRERQKVVWQELSECGFTGPVMVHCEREDMLKPNLFDSKNPWTWALARPALGERMSFRDQIELIEETNFQGHFHGCHVSCSFSVEEIIEARQRGLKVSCGITPQHYLFSAEQIMVMESFLGILLKCNPAIGLRINQQELRKSLKKGYIDFFETDHAPHTEKDKYRNYASGVMSLLLLPETLIELKKQKFSNREIKNLLRENALKIFTKIKV